MTLFVVSLGFLCIAVRVLPALVMRNSKISPMVYKTMAYLPVTIFTAMIFTDIFFWESHFNLNLFENIKLIPALVSIFVAYRFKDIIKTIIAGVGTIALLYFLF
ncbi:AzlD domain-containing protein [Aerococcus urinaeequi]|uniref:Branched-chain amino acid transporter n=1 Tax=Aerococcus urinaeequi TaxID=51665 RepID=A0AAC8WZ51_9LACT|nr:AzlD domain-containing protein [Aerococcus urinaeequi]AMB96868.1 branched-chain amino acid transporter [Aerococcus urinaeequi]